MRIILSALLALALAADAGAAALRPLSATDEAAMGLVHLGPLTLPGRDQLSGVRLEAELKVRDGEKQTEEVQHVLTLRPRIVGSVLQAFEAQPVTTRNLSAADTMAIKQRIRDAANAALGEPYIDEVLILRLLVT